MRRKKKAQRKPTTDEMRATGHCGLLDLALIRRALDGEDVEEAKEHMDRFVLYKPGDLVEYQQAKDGEWVPGVVVAWMVHEPMYVCGEGDDRDAAGKKGMLGCKPRHVRPRGAADAS
jgi:hypothetical protein